jgi:hypothetical protein
MRCFDDDLLACAYIFGEMGEDQEAIDNLWYNLDLKIDAMSRQNAREMRAPGDNRENDDEEDDDDE